MVICKWEMNIWIWTSGGRSGLKYRHSIYVIVEAMEAMVMNKIGQCEETTAVNGTLRNTNKGRHELLII